MKKAQLLVPGTRIKHRVTGELGIIRRFLPNSKFSMEDDYKVKWDAYYDEEVANLQSFKVLKNQAPIYNDYLREKGLKPVRGGDFFRLLPKKQKFPILVVHKKVKAMDWNKHLLFPLIPEERVVNLGTPFGVDSKYILVRRGSGVSLFDKKMFTVPTKINKNENNATI